MLIFIFELLCFSVNTVSVTRIRLLCWRWGSWDVLPGRGGHVLLFSVWGLPVLSGDDNPSPSPVHCPHVVSRPRGGCSSSCWRWCWGCGKGESRISWTIYQLVPAMLSSGLLPAALSVISGFWVSQSCSHLCNWLFLHVICVVIFPINMILSLFLTSGSPQNFCPSIPPILVFKHCCEFIPFKDRFSGIFRNLRWE